MKNQKTLAWWEANFDTATRYNPILVGELLKVPITDVFPSLDFWDHPTGTEYETAEYGTGKTRDPISVSIERRENILIIEDGHHRFNDAVIDKKRQVSVKIISVKSAYLAPFFAK